MVWCLSRLIEPKLCCIQRLSNATFCFPSNFPMLFLQDFIESAFNDWKEEKKIIALHHHTNIKCITMASEWVSRIPCQGNTLLPLRNIKLNLHELKWYYLRSQMQFLESCLHRCYWIALFIALLSVQTFIHWWCVWQQSKHVYLETTKHPIQ